MRKLGLLIFCDSPNQAEEFTSLVRTLGYAIDQCFVDNSSGFTDELGSGRYQLALITINHERSEIPTADAYDHDTPIIALIENYQFSEAGELLENGASDIAFLDDPGHIRHCVRKALKVQQLESQLKHANDRLEESQHQLTVLLQSTNQAIAFVHDGMHVYANPAYLQMFEYRSLEDLQATPLMDLIAEADERTRLAESVRDIESNRSVNDVLEITFVNRDETQLRTLVQLTANRFDGENAVQLILTPSDYDGAEQILPQPKPPGLQISDPVTQLYNRQHMLTLLEDTVAHAREFSTEYMLYFVHLETGPDDTDYANRCMQAAAERLLDIIDENDVLGRYGGNTFFLISLFHKNKQPEAYAEKLRRAIGDLDGLLPGITRSRVTGVIIDKYCKDGEQAIARLKDNFIQAQESNDAVKIDVAQFIHMSANQIMNQVWARRVSTILKNNRLTLTSIPIISLRHDVWERYSLQLQLSDENGKSLPLTQFRDTVIHSGLASNVDRWIIFNAARQLVEKLRDNPTIQFFVPLIGNVTLEEDLYPWIEKVIEQFKLPTNSIMLQATVASALEFPDAFSQFCKQMTKINCGVYLTGLDDPTITHALYNNSKNRIKYLAISSNLLNGLHDDPAKLEAIEILVDQCHRESTLTIVPDVVDSDVLSELWKLGVDLIVSSSLADQSADLMELDLTATLSA